MTPEAQRIAIAAACGWTLCRADNKTWRTPEQKAKNLELLGHENGPWNFESSGPPDYLNDLNAMHEAVMSRCNNGKGGQEFGRWLVKIVLGYDFDDVPVKHQILNHWELMRLANATASQRAEAFLRTLNLWTDEQ